MNHPNPEHPTNKGFVALAGPYNEREQWMVDRIAADLEAAGIGYVVHAAPKKNEEDPELFTVYRASKGLQTMDQTAALQVPRLAELEDDK